MNRSFHDELVDLFHRHFRRLYRYLDRLSGEPDLAADLAQEAFVRLHRRGSSPDNPEAWLITVATNLLRNARSTRARRSRLLGAAHGGELIGGVGGEAVVVPPEEAAGGVDRERVRSVLDRMRERERQMLLLCAEGYSYREIAAALALNESSVGTLLARAKKAFRELYGEGTDASRA